MSAEPVPARSIRAKLTASLVLTALISAALVAIVGVRLIRQAANETALREMRRQAIALSDEAVFLQREPGRVLRLLISGLGLSGATLYRIDSAGNLTILGGEVTVPLTARDAAELASGRGIEGTRGQFLFVAQPIGGGQLAIVLGREAGLAGSELPVGRRLLIAALIALAVAAAVSAYLGNRITSPLVELSEAARDVARGRFDRRVGATSEDEIGIVAASFNQMAEALGDADRRQREFFLSVSHELRTPLTAIQGYAEAIEDGTVGEKGQKDAAAVILQESKRLTRLVSDLLDLARIDAQRFTVETRPVLAGEVLDSVTRKFAVQAKEAGVEITATDGGVELLADPDRLVQVLSNLVENALRYTPSGKSIQLRAVADGSRCTIDVIDTGLGFSEQDLSRAFERQYLWGKYRGLREVGSGLGLAISKELAEAMGGSVHASNSESGGAKFTVSLPLA